MGRVLAPSVVHSGFEHRSVQIRDYAISINCFQGRNQRRSLGTCTPSLKSVWRGRGGGQKLCKNTEKTVFLIMTATKWVRRICCDNNDYFLLVSFESFPYFLIHSKSLSPTFRFNLTCTFLASM